MEWRLIFSESAVVLWTAFFIFKFVEVGRCERRIFRAWNKICQKETQVPLQRRIQRMVPYFVSPAVWVRISLLGISTILFSRIR